MSVARPKGPKGRADDLFSKLIRQRGACQRCGSTDNLQCAHIIGRTFSRVRCNPDNAWCLCASCHAFLGLWPNLHMAFVAETIGMDRFDELAADAQTHGRPVDWVAVVADLKTQLELL